VFECLLPESFDTIFLNCLFELAMWHAFGKLHIHTETTLNHFDNSTTQLGKILHKFYKGICTNFHTFDLPQESAACACHRGQQAGKGKQKENDPRSRGSARNQWTFNLSLYKLHTLSDYVKSIWLFRTMDNYMTQVVCTYVIGSYYSSMCEVTMVK
jgi:hypothetical protein